MSENTHQSSSDNIEIEKVEFSKLSPGVISWRRSDGRLIKLFHPGQLIQSHLLERFKNSKRELIYDIYINPDFMMLLYKAMLELKASELEQDRVLARDKILSLVKKIYWEGKKDGCLLDLVLVFEKVFSKLTSEDEQLLYQTSELLFRRSYLVSTLNVIFALTLGYLNFESLQDIYHVAFFYDFSFSQNKPSYTLMQSLSCEQAESGGGVELIHQYSDEGLDLVGHIEESYELALKEMSNYFFDSSYLKLILNHHEKIDGSGLYKKTCHKEISDLEAIIIFVNNIIEYQEVKYKKNDGVSYIQNLITGNGKKIKTILSSRLKSVFIKAIGNIHEKSVEITQSKKGA